jgi:hypothetical protein
MRVASWIRLQKGVRSCGQRCILVCGGLTACGGATWSDPTQGVSQWDPPSTQGWAPHPSGSMSCACTAAALSSSSPKYGSSASVMEAKVEPSGWLLAPCRLGACRCGRCDGRGWLGVAGGRTVQSVVQVASQDEGRAPDDMKDTTGAPHASEDRARLQDTGTRRAPCCALPPQNAPAHARHTKPESRGPGPLHGPDQQSRSLSRGRA